MKLPIAATLFVYMLGSAAVRAAAQDEPGPAATPTPTASAPASFVERSLRRGHRNAGFSVGVSESYAPNFIVNTSGGQTSMTFTTLSPRFFFGLQNTRQELLFDYSFGYRQYNRNNLVSSSTHAGIVTYQRRLSPNVTWSLANEFRSGANDQGLSLGTTVSFSAAPIFEQPLFLPRHRTTSELARSSIDFHVAKRTNLNFYGAYSLWQYQGSAIEYTRTGEVGIIISHQFNRWFFLDNTFSQYLSVQGQARNGNIQRMKIGEIRLQTLRKLQLSFGGGIESASYRGIRRNIGTGSVGLSKNSATTAFSVIYHRGFSLAVGPGALLAGNNLSLSVTQWLGRRVNLQLYSLYTHGGAFDQSKLNSIAGNAQLEVALNPHLVLSGQYTHLSQRAAGLSIAAPTIATSTGSIGFQYFLSALHER